MIYFELIHITFRLTFEITIGTTVYENLVIVPSVWETGCIKERKKEMT
jgi:hypothetical protein